MPSLVYRARLSQVLGGAGINGTEISGKDIIESGVPNGLVSVGCCNDTVFRPA